MATTKKFLVEFVCEAPEGCEDIKLLSSKVGGEQIITAFAMKTDSPLQPAIFKRQITPNFEKEWKKIN